MDKRLGTIKVVTGAGKTVLGLAIIDHLVVENENLRVAIVVPTVVLQKQWVSELRTRSATASDEWIGELGGGRREGFADGKRVVVAVLNSASKALADDVVASGVGDDLLLIVDECHRAGAPIMSRLFRTPRAYTLGLSATPERSDEDDEREIGTEIEPAGRQDGYNSSILGREIGPIVYRLNLDDAIAMGVLPPFSIHHYGIGLMPDESAKYESLSRSIKDARERLEGVLLDRGGSARNLIPFAQRLARNQGPHAALAARFMSEAQDRKRLLYRAPVGGGGSSSATRIPAKPRR
jgi:superfamily II DNA or RNA helicase